MAEPEQKPILTPLQKKLDKKRPGVSYPNRLLQALASVYEDELASRQEKLQAVRLSLDTLDKRTKPKRKTDRDKAVIKALENPATNLEKPKKIIPISPE